VPLPAPLAPAATVTHEASVVVVHVQPLPVVTLTRISSGPLPAL
jgi:hypothetical protein